MLPALALQDWIWSKFCCIRSNQKWANFGVKLLSRSVNHSAFWFVLGETNFQILWEQVICSHCCYSDRFKVAVHMFSITSLSFFLISSSPLYLKRMGENLFVLLPITRYSFCTNYTFVGLLCNRTQSLWNLNLHQVSFGKSTLSSFERCMSGCQWTWQAQLLWWRFDFLMELHRLIKLKV